MDDSDTIHHEAEVAGMDPVQRLTKDLRLAAEALGEREVRFLVDAYYQLQGNRIIASHQKRTLDENEEPSTVLLWLFEQNETLERQIHGALDRYTNHHPVGQWMKSQMGIGPVISAGMLCHIDITRAPTCGHIWRFAGQDPTVTWNKGEKRPWNADLKRLCWLLGECFVKVSGKDEAFYGKLYKQRKEREIAKNEAGEFADQAAAILVKRNIGEETEAYKAYIQGKLPPAHIHSRAKRFAVKIFLSHLHEVWRTNEGLEVPVPFAIAHLGHVHMINPPNFIKEQFA